MRLPDYRDIAYIVNMPITLLDTLTPTPLASDFEISRALLFINA